jgi:hypothetical protein
MLDADHVAHQLARSQHGAFGRAQLLARGVGSGAVDRRVRTGRWIRLASGVYVLPSHAGTWERQLWIAHLAHPASVLGLGTAAVLHRFEAFQRGKVELIVPPSAGARSSVARLHRFSGTRTTTWRGLPVTTVTQTVVDLCSTIWGSKLEGALDRLLLERRVTIEELEERANAYAGTRRRGLPLYVAMVRERSGAAWRPSESRLEDELRTMLGLVSDAPEIIFQPSLPWRPNTKERLDALLPQHGILVEADGRAWHARLDDFDRDRWRDNEAIAHGLRPLRFTWVHLTQRRVASARLVEDAMQSSRARPAA